MLNVNQEKCINLMVYTEDTQKNIAKQLGVTEQTITAWKKQDAFRQALAEELKVALGITAVNAYKTVGKLMSKSQNDFVRLNAAKDILDRAGYKPVEKQEVKADVNNKVDLSNMSTEEIKELLQEE